MIARSIALGLSLSLLPLAVATADEVGGADISVPSSPPPREKVVVVDEQPVSAPPPAFVALDTTSIAAGVGISWGDGTLNFEGRNYGFEVKGISLGDLGAAKLAGEGDVSNLEQVSDFAGTYVAVSAGAAAVNGASALTMRNENGVVITLNSNLTGAQLKLGAEGFTIAMK